MRQLLLFFFFVVGAHTYTVYFKNNCTSEIQVHKGYMAPPPNVETITLSPAQQKAVSIDLPQKAPGFGFAVSSQSFATFAPAAGQRTNFTLTTYDSSDKITLLKPACASGQPCPAFRCGLVGNVPDACKKDGDTTYSQEVGGSRPNTMNYYVTYCATP